MKSGNSYWVLAAHIRFSRQGSTVGNTLLYLSTAGLVACGLAVAETPPLKPPQPDAAGSIPSEVFTVLFVTLGPIKVIAPFSKPTERADDAFRRRLALRAFSFSGVVAVLLGSSTLAQWNVAVLIFFVTINRVCPAILSFWACWR